MPEAPLEHHLAKTRRKGWRRVFQVCIGLVLVAGIALAWAGVELYRHSLARPLITTDYRRQIAALSAAAQPPGENAWPAIQSALAIWREVEDELSAMRSDPFVGEVEPYYQEDLRFNGLLDTPFEISRYPREMLGLQVLEERGVFDLLAGACQMPRVIPDRPRSVAYVFDPLNEVKNIRGFAEVNLARMRIASESRDSSEFVACLKQALMLGRSLSFDSTMFAHSLAQSLQSNTLKELIRELEESTFDAGTCRQLLEVINAHATVAPVAHFMEVERLTLQDQIQHSFSDDGGGGGYMLPDAVASIGTRRPTPSTALLLGRFYMADRHAVTERSDEMIEQLASIAGLPPAERVAALNSFETALDELHPMREMFAVTLLSTLVVPVRFTHVTELWIAAARTMIAIEWFEAEKGRLPATLAEISAEITSGLPLDPTSVQPLVYRLVEDDPFKRRFLLYSTGLDQVDNGGTEMPDSPTGTYQANRPLYELEGKGYDVIMNRPRLKALAE